jgi:hypothetical protein
MKTKTEIPIQPIVTGSVFLQDTIIDERHCYICNKEFNKFDDRYMLLLRVAPGKLGFCCPEHKGVVAEFIRQYKTIPGGWIRNDKETIADIINTSDDNNSESSGSGSKTEKRNNKPTDRVDGTPKEHLRNKRRKKHK